MDVPRKARELRSRALGSLNARLRGHLRGAAPVALARSFPRYLAEDAAIACWQLFQELPGEAIRCDESWTDLLDAGEVQPDPGPSSPALERYETDGGVVHYGLRRGLAFLRFEGDPLVAYGCTNSRTWGYEVRVAAAREEVAKGFLAALAEVMEAEPVFSARVRGELKNSINGRVRAHLGLHEGRTPELVLRSFPAYQIPNVSILIKDYLESLEAELLGVPSGRYERADPLEFMEEPRISDNGKFQGYRQRLPEIERISVRLGESREALKSGLALLTFQGAPLIVACYRSDAYDKKYEIAVAGWDGEAVSALLEGFESYEREHSIFRGRLVRPVLSYRDEIEEAHIIDYTPIDWDQIVLPGALKETIQEEVIEYAHRAEALARNGVSVKRGVLLHGPPGTGKTHLCRVLTSVLSGFTGIVLAGENLRRPSGAFAMARKLAPALIFFEDVDLVASDRDSNSATGVLGTLLNELDGLEQNEEVYCVFTTNRLDALEEALSQRPGRVDLILEFPLPGVDLRRRLIELYVGQASLEADVEALVAQTEGVTPAFLRELMKQAVYEALRASPEDAPGPARVSEQEVQAALEKLQRRCANPQLERILGFRSGLSGSPRG
jgi:energy-coupling factor transporter ATP-binding protein EcfA2